MKKILLASLIILSFAGCAHKNHSQEGDKAHDCKACSDSKAGDKKAGAGCADCKCK